MTATLGQLRWQFLRSTVLFWIGGIFLLDGLLFLVLTFVFTLAGISDALLRNVFLAVGALQLAIGLVLATLAWRRSNRRAHVILDGIPTLGIVAAVVEDTSVRINNKHPHYLKYAFVDDFGQKHEGQSAYLPANKLGHWSPGDHLLILVDRDSPARHVADVTDVRAEDLADLRKRWESGRA